MMFSLCDYVLGSPIVTPDNPIDSFHIFLKSSLSSIIKVFFLFLYFTLLVVGLPKLQKNEGALQPPMEEVGAEDAFVCSIDFILMAR